MHPIFPLFPPGGVVDPNANADEPRTATSFAPPPLPLPLPRPLTLMASPVPSRLSRLCQEARSLQAAWSDMPRDLRLAAETPAIQDAFAAWQRRQWRHLDGLIHLVRTNQCDVADQALREGWKIHAITGQLLNCSNAGSTLAQRERLMRRLDTAGPLRLTRAEDLDRFTALAAKAILTSAMGVRDAVSMLDTLLDSAQPLPYPAGTQTAILAPGNAAPPRLASYGPWPGMLTLGSGEGVLLLGTGGAGTIQPRPR